MALLEHEKQIREYEKTLQEVKEQNKNNQLWTPSEIKKLEGKLARLKEKVYSGLTPWQRVEICRHPKRPRSVDYIKAICHDFTEIHGDRSFRDDPSIITGFCRIGGQKFMMIAQEKGFDTETRIARNFGSPHPEGYRKALRCMKLAAKFKLPVLALLDTPGAFAGLAAEERGQGWAISANLMEMSILPTQMIAILIGEGCSGGALGVGMADRIAMLEHSYYSVISPEGCASILWNDSSQREKAADALKIHAEDLLPFGIVDTVIPEPQGGAHHNTDVVFKAVEEYILRTIGELKLHSLDTLLNERYEKFRRMGEFQVMSNELG